MIDRLKLDKSARRSPLHEQYVCRADQLLIQQLFPLSKAENTASNLKSEKIKYLDFAVKVK